MQNFNRQSPIDLPSSSNTSKQSNGTKTADSNKYQFGPEVRQIGQQYTEIVKCLQAIEESATSTAPQISAVIAKLYSVKSAYEQVISNMGSQITQIQQH